MSTVSKKEFKDLADAIGMPDNTDKENIRKIILRYEKKNPGYVAGIRNMARQEHLATSTAGSRKRVFGEVNKQSGGRLLFELPEQLHQDIEAYIPTIFREKKHFQWFVKNFKELLVPDKY